MSYRSMGWLFILALPVVCGACSVSVDQYEFVEDAGSGDGDSGDGDGDGTLAAGRERLNAQWATECIEGDPMEGDPGVQYVYTFDDGELRLDMWAYFSDCSEPLWVQTIQADYRLQGFDRETDTFIVRLTITDFEIMLLDEDVADEAKMVELYGRNDWVAFEWIELLGFPTDNGTLKEGDMGYIAFTFLGRDEDGDDLAIGASLITLGAIPTMVLDKPFTRTDGEISAEDL